MTDTWQDVPPARTDAPPRAPDDGWQDVPPATAAAAPPEPIMGTGASTGTQGISDRLSRGFAATNNPFAIYAGGKLKDVAGDTAEFFHQGISQTVDAITGNGTSQFEDIRPEVEKQLISVGRTPESAKQETDALMRSWRRQERMGGAIMGPMTALTAPLLGAYRSLISRPLEEAGGPPKEVTEMAGMVIGAVAGMPEMARTMARVKVSPDGKVNAQAIGDLPKGEDFKTAADLLTRPEEPAAPSNIQRRLGPDVFEEGDKAVIEGAPRADYVEKIGSGDEPLPTMQELSAAIEATKGADLKYSKAIGLTEQEFNRIRTLNRMIDNGSDAAIKEKNAILDKVDARHELDIPDEGSLRQLRIEFESLERSALETPAEHQDGIARVLKRYIGKVIDDDPFARAVFRKALDESNKAGFDTKALTNDVINRYLSDLSPSDQVFARQEFERFLRVKIAPDPTIVEQNLRTLWDERGIHPAEALHEAKGDAWLKHELTQPAPPEPEKIQTAAIRVEGKTFTGFAHADAVIAAEDAMGLEPGALFDKGKVENGFLTTTGRFVDRHEANRIVGFAAESGGLDAWNLPALHDQAGLVREPHPDRPLGEALRAVDELRAANRGLPTEDRAILGEMISAVRSAAAKRQLSVEDGAKASPLPEGLSVRSGPSKEITGNPRADSRAHEIQIVDQSGKVHYRGEVTQEGGDLWGIGFVENVSQDHSGLAKNLYGEMAKYVEDRGGKLIAGMNQNRLSRRVTDQLKAEGLAEDFKVGDRNLLRILPEKPGVVQQGDRFKKAPLVTPDTGPERVVGATVIVDGKVFIGASHLEALEKVRNAGYGLEQYKGNLNEPGHPYFTKGDFISSEGRLLSTEEAANLTNERNANIKDAYKHKTIRSENAGIQKADVEKFSKQWNGKSVSELVGDRPEIVETAWVEADQDLARAQAAMARIDEVKARHPELAGTIDKAVAAVEDTLAQRDAMRPKSLGAAATDAPMTPLTEQPPAPAGALMASAQEGVKTLFDIGRDIQMKVAPMATGTRDSILVAKDFANTMRKNRWEWARIHDYLTKTFSPEQWKRMWDAADEESVLRQEMGTAPKGLPPVKSGFIRFFHGGDNPTSGGGRWVNQSETYATNYRPGESVHYVDIPHSFLDQRFPDVDLYRPRDGTTAQSYPSFEVPEQFAKQMKPVKGTAAGKGGAVEHMGLATLEPAERNMVEMLHARAENAWLRARDIGLVEGEGLPAYTPRMVINAAGAIAEQGSLPLNSIGTNLKASTARLMKRKYLTAEETEAAAKAKTGYAEALKLKSMDEINAAMEKVELVRDIRTLPLAIAQLEDAIAGRTLVNEIKKAGKAGGSEAVAEGAVPSGSEQKWFTIDHPALKTWRPKFQEIDGKVQVVKDKDGNTIFEQVPIYIRGDFEGPLRAVLDTKSGATYQALMSLKGKTMSVIMYSPAIHNLVELGRAFPAMPTRILKAYFDGNRAKNDVAIMTEAIDSGLVPIGKRFFKQDLDAIMESPDLTPGQSWTAKVLAAVPGLFDEGAGIAVKRAVDKAGDFWHNYLLWDRIADLQMGLYVNLRGDLIGKGVDAKTASITAAHWANRYAGALPQEAMSSAARKSANMLLFSRSFTMGNLGVMKDMVTGLPKDALAMIEREGGFKPGSLSSAEDIPQVGDFTKGMARRKAIAVVMLDIGLMYVGNSVLQSSLNVMLGDKTIDEEGHGYARRFKEVLNDVNTHPLSLLQPFSIAERLSSTGENEPGRRDRIMIGHQSDGTAIYARNPVGKIGEEFIGYMANPLEMLRKKEGTVARPMLQIFQNDKGFGRKVYDPNAETPMDKAAAIWAMVEHFGKAQTPEGQINALSDLVKGEGDPKTSVLQTAGPFLGVTFSKGAPGGPATGELYDFRQRHDVKVNMALPDIRKQILRGDVGGALQRMRELDIPPGLQRFYVRTTLDPSTRVGGRTLRDFYMGATPEQRDRLERARQ